LLVFDLGEVAHQPSNHAVYCLLELAVVDVNLQADVESLNAGIVFQAVLNEFVNLSRAESGESADLVNDHEVEPPLSTSSRSTFSTNLEISCPILGIVKQQYIFRTWQLNQYKIQRIDTARRSAAVIGGTLPLPNAYVSRGFIIGRGLYRRLTRKTV
jgi:hypothetical protein